MVVTFSTFTFLIHNLESYNLIIHVEKDSTKKYFNFSKHFYYRQICGVFLSTPVYLSVYPQSYLSIYLGKIDKD